MRTQKFYTLCVISVVAFAAIGGASSASAPAAGPAAALPHTPQPPPSLTTLDGSAPAAVARSHAPHPLSSVAAIVEGDVTSIRTAYDEQAGPRTIAVIERAKAHAGIVPSTFEIAQLGGPLPDGSFLTVSETPQFTVGAHYIVFLTSQRWIYSPIWADLAFRVERFGTKDVVIGPQGLAVVNFSVSGVQFGNTPLLTSAPLEARTPTVGPALVSGPLVGLTDVSRALGKEDFVRNAVAAAMAAGGPLGAAVSMTPDPGSSWRTQATAPAAP